MSTADRRGDERRLLQPHDGGDLLFGRFVDSPRDLAEAILDETAINVLEDDRVDAAGCRLGTWPHVPVGDRSVYLLRRVRTLTARASEAVNARNARRSSPRYVRDGHEQQRSKY